MLCSCESRTESILWCIKLIIFVRPFGWRIILTTQLPERLAQDYCGTSDPYVEIYVNDVKRVPGSSPNPRNAGGLEVSCYRRSFKAWKTPKMFGYATCWSFNPTKSLYHFSAVFNGRGITKKWSASPIDQWCSPNNSCPSPGSKSSRELHTTSEVEPLGCWDEIYEEKIRIS